MKSQENDFTKKGIKIKIEPATKIPDKLFTEVVTQKPTTMLIIMTMIADILPIGAIGRIIIMIAILMMYGQLMQIGRVELTGALGTDPAMQLERFFTITAAI
jgi:hypothetical protein